MPWGLKRYHESDQTHFITFSCHRRLPLLNSRMARRTFEMALERVRRKYRLCVYGYVIMPEHVHLLVSEPDVSNLAQAVKSLKQGVSRRLIGTADHFWQERYYDHYASGVVVEIESQWTASVWEQQSFVGKLRYIHVRLTVRKLPRSSQQKA